MTALIRAIPALFALMLINVFIVGCALKKAAQPVVTRPEAAISKKTQSEGCRACHAPNMAAMARDFSLIYDNPKSHHPVGIRYLDAAQDAAKFALPDGRGTDIAFFDRNNNELHDSDEIVLFGSATEVTIECASCHREHGDTPISVRVPERFYLRLENVGSTMCITCHRY